MPYASGKRSYGISDRSGFRYRLRDMKKEWTGSLVGPDEFEPKQPQLTPPKVYPDPQALRDARPETNLTEERSIQHGFNPVGFRTISGITPTNNLVPTADVGGVTITVTDFIGNTADVSGVQGSSAIGTVSITIPDEDETVNVTGVSGTATVGTVSVTTPDATVNVTGLAGTTAIGTVSVTTLTATYTVTVASGTNSYGTGNKFYIDGSVSPTLTLNEGGTYRFDQSDSSNSTHPLRFSTTANGTHGGGSEYTTGVTTNGTPGSSGAYTQITVASGAPTLYYYCTNHSGMGGQANTP
tara:strand:- start:2 stop:892 length:891 start_codon:yes stop_codon:yes gene_type:complete